MAVKVRTNRASLTLSQNLVRQIDGKTKNRRALLRAFERSGLPERWAAVTRQSLNALHRVLLNVFEGNVKGIGGGVSSVSGIDLARP